MVSCQTEPSLYGAVLPELELAELVVVELELDVVAALDGLEERLEELVEAEPGFEGVELLWAKENPAEPVNAMAMSKNNLCVMGYLSGC